MVYAFTLQKFPVVSAYNSPSFSFFYYAISNKSFDKISIPFLFFHVYIQQGVQLLSLSLDRVGLEGRILMMINEEDE